MASTGNVSAQYLRVLLYGQAGSTKTRTSCTAVFDERLSPVLYLNAAGNPVSIREYDPQPTIINIEDLKDFNDPYTWIRLGQPANHSFAKMFGLKTGFKTIIIDQLTDVQRLSFKVVLGADSIGPGDFPAQREWSHYNKVLYQMVNFAKLYYALPIHVIMTALESDREESPGVTRIVPALEGESRNEIPGYAQLVGRLVNEAVMRPALAKVIEKEYSAPSDAVLFLKPSGRFVAKNQYGGLPDVLVDPTMTTIMDGIYGPINK